MKNVFLIARLFALRFTLLIAPLIALLSVLLLPVTATATAPALGSSVAKAIVKYFGKEGGEQATKYLTRQGGKEVAERVTAAATRQGGEEAVQLVAKVVSKHGPDAVAALDNSPSIMPVLKALDELPAAQIKTALTRLAAGATGRELAESTAKVGSVALRAELKHPGVGGVLVRAMGDDGAKLAMDLTTDQAIAVARHADDLAKLPMTQKSGVLALIRQDGQQFFAFLARFAEKNPGKTLFTAATTTVILAESERMLGGDEIVFDADGNPVVVTKPGIVGRIPDVAGDVAEHVSRRYIQPVFYSLLAFALVFASIWAFFWFRKQPASPTDET